MTEYALVVTATGEGTVTLFIQFIDNETGEMTTETYDGDGEVVVTLPRTEETYYINYWATAMAWEVNVIPGISQTEYFVEVPAKELPPVVVGDIDGDGKVAISDVSALIDYLLSPETSSVNPDDADLDHNGSVTIADLSALIDYILSGTW